MKYVLDTHSHTISSGHAYSTINEMAEEASKKSLELICMTDHAPSMLGASCIYHFHNLKILPRKMHGVIVLKGVEANILDIKGKLDMPTRSLEKLEVVIASLHLGLFEGKTKEEYTLGVVNAIKNNPNINIIGHLCDPRFPIDIEPIVEAAKENNVAIEINNTSLNPLSPRAGGENEIRDMVQICKEKNVFITIGSDAHIHFDLGEFTFANSILEEIGMPERLILNTSVNKFTDFLGIDI